MRNSHGFSLLELLVAVATVGLLAVLTIGVGRRILGNSKASASVSNLRQIATAMHAYAADHDDYLPRGYFFQTGKSEVSYATELMPYLGNQPSPLQPRQNIFVAPTAGLAVPVKPANAFIPITYSVHGVLCPDTSKGGQQMRRRAVQRPSEVILIGDSAQNPGSRNSLCTFKAPEAFYEPGATQPLAQPIPIGPDSDTTKGLGYLRYRTNGKAAVAMVDGHVALLEKGAVKYGNLIIDR